jgi:hypothetical protein
MTTRGEQTRHDADAGEGAAIMRPVLPESARELVEPDRPAPAGASGAATGARAAA